MVAIKSHEADRFLAREAAGFAAYLVFGADVGLISERVRFILRALVDDPADAFQVVRLRGEDVSSDPGRLADEVNTVPMFGGRRAVVIDGVGRDLTQALSHHLAGAPVAPVVIEAGAVKKDAALRKLFERSKNAVAIECYPDDEAGLARLIDTEFLEAGLAIDPEAKAMLGSLLGADRLASRAELTKLALYAHGQPAVTAEDVEAIVADAAAQATDALIDATFSGDFTALEQAGRRVLTGPVEVGLFLGSALRHGMWLHRSSLELSKGAALEGLMVQASRMGVAPRRKAGVERILRSASPDMLSLAVIRLGEAVGRVRREPMLGGSIALRTLWTVARAMQRRARR